TAADQTMLFNLPAPGPPGSYPPHGPPPDPPTYTGTLASLGIEFMFTKVPVPGHTVLVTGLPLTPVNATPGHVAAAGRRARHRPADRGGPGRRGVQPDAVPCGAGPEPPRGQRGAAAPVRRRRLP